MLSRFVFFFIKRFIFESYTNIFKDLYFIVAAYINFITYIFLERIKLSRI